jgi:hypothetical protein
MEGFTIFACKSSDIMQALLPVLSFVVWEAPSKAIYHYNMAIPVIGIMTT